MTKTQNAPTAKVANTINGCAIALLTKTSHRGGTYYEVARVNPDNKYLVIHRTSDYEKARTLANRQWASDRAV